MASLASGALGRLVAQRDRSEVGIAPEIARDLRVAGLAYFAAYELLGGISGHLSVRFRGQGNRGESQQHSPPHLAFR